MNEEQIQSFWQQNPCGDAQVGGLKSFDGNYLSFFEKYDAFRYGEYPELLKILDSIDFNGRSVLEIGIGQGADSEQIIRRGGVWSGVDLTQEAVERVTVRLKLKGLPYRDIKQGTVLSLPFDDDSFDIVYSCGVLHHVPEIRQASSEIYRVLKANGELIVMLYAKESLNYVLSIRLLRRFLLAIAYCFGLKGGRGSKLEQHIKNAKQSGLFNYLKMDNFIHRNTDGPLNPYSKVYTLEAVKEDFPQFVITRSYKAFMHAPPLPVQNLPGGRIMGWHLWVHMRPIK